MIGLMEIWRLLTGRAEQEAVARNTKVHAAVKEQRKLGAYCDLEQIDRLMRGDGTRGNDHGEPAS
jgi:hypothetical protein